jgi:hypothetical protein
MRRQPAPLHILINALPDEALRPLLLELLATGTSAIAESIPGPARRASRPRQAAKRRHGGGWPKGKPRRGPGRPPKVETAAEMEAKLAARRERNNAIARARRAAARPATATDHGSDGAGGNGAARPRPTAAMLWAHAAALSPKTPWRAVARELGVNEAQALDSYRLHKVPPGITPDLLAHFLELSPA